MSCRKEINALNNCKYESRQEEFKANLDYGFGLRWFSPIGVLRFEFGYPINPENENAGSQFHFDIGQLF